MTDRTGEDRGADATVRALATTRSTTRTLADALLTHLPEVGDPRVQRALDAWVEQAADTLRALSDLAEERLLDAASRDGGAW
jgi:hypothetical protein